jgi:hypothetical protein
MAKTPPHNPYPAVVGDWKFTCPIEGKTYYASQAVRRWDGVLVGPRAGEETRNEQELLRVRAETQPPFTRARPNDAHVALGCTAEGMGAYAGRAVAGCAVAGRKVGQ